MKNLKHRAKKLLAVFCLIFSAQAMSLPIKIEFEGIIPTWQAKTFLIPESLSRYVKRGDKVSGYYTLDTALPDIDAASNIGQYALDSEQYGFRINLGNAFVSSIPGQTNMQLRIADNYDRGRSNFTFDELKVSSRSIFNVFHSDTELSYVNFFLGSSENLNLFQSDKLSDLNFSIEDLSFMYGIIGDPYRDKFRITYDITSFKISNLTEVPEPYLAPAFLLIALIAIARKKKKYSKKP